MTFRPSECHPEKQDWAKGECRRCYNRNWWRKKNGSSGRKPKDPKSKRRRALLKAFGISLEQYNAMLSSQQGKCAICERAQSDRALAVDHCHSTGKIRGLLCTGCNTLVGHVEKRQSLIESAKIYLQQCKSNQDTSPKNSGQVQ